MKIGITSDHRGFKNKEILKEFLIKIGYDVIDYGTDSEMPADFPDYAFKLGDAIASKKVDLGIAICGTGIGMSIALNKVITPRLNIFKKYISTSFIFLK